MPQKTQVLEKLRFVQIELRAAQFYRNDYQLV